MTGAIVDGAWLAGPDGPGGEANPAAGLAQDPALWTGLGVFETLRTVSGTILCLGAHLERLGESAAFFGWSWDRAAVERELHQLVERASATPVAPGAPGSARGDLKLNVLLTPTRRVVTAAPLDAARVNAPIRCATVDWQPPPWLPGFVKHTSRAGPILAARAATARLGEPVDEVLFRDERGCWTEANRSSLLAVREGAVWTAPLDGRILAGVTRARALEAARMLGIPVHEADVSSAAAWDELYACSTLKELAPIVQIDGRDGPGEGPVGSRIRLAMATQATDTRRPSRSGRRSRSSRRAGSP